MNTKEYQEQAARTLIDKPDFELSGEEIMLLWNGLGLSGEAGEVADLIKKGLLHRHGLDKEKLTDEIGDVMWYLAAICTELGIDLETVLENNIKKLKIRYPKGFSSTDSQLRVDVE